MAQYLMTFKFTTEESPEAMKLLIRELATEMKTHLKEGERIAAYRLSYVVDDTEKE